MKNEVSKRFQFAKEQHEQTTSLSPKYFYACAEQRDEGRDGDKVVSDYDGLGVKTRDPEAACIRHSPSLSTILTGACIVLCAVFFVDRLA